MNLSQNILWLTDPWSTLTHSQDTTLRLMDEALKMGLPTYWSSSDFILKTSSPSTVLVSKITHLTHEPSSFIEIEASKFHQLHYRLDPPVDFSYISLLEQLEARSTRITNPPALLKHQSEKLPPKELAHLTPRGCVVTDLNSVAVAISLFDHESKNNLKIVSKPLNQAQSKGVASWTAPTDENGWNELCSRLTENFSQPILLQEYLPEIFSAGEVRMWFANGDFIAALKKYPIKGDFRVLIDEGSRVEAYTLSVLELASAKEVGAVLKKQGAKLAAIDFIQGKISDYNITSPGLLVQLEEVHQKNFAIKILEITII